MRSQNLILYPMPVSFNVNKLWQGFTGKTKINPVNIVAQRFLQVFHDHGVQAAQIPRLLPKIKLDDLKSEETLLSALTPEVLDQAAHFFGIRSEWLEGVDDKIYEYQSCYKQPEVFFELLAGLQNRADSCSLNFPLRILSATNKLDGTSDSQQLLAPVLVEKIAELGEEPIFRYTIFNDSFNWGYFPTRIQLKAMARLIVKVMHKPVPLFVVSPAELESIIEREMIPHKFLHGCLLTEPSMEDFALTKEESLVAKEIAEMPYVLSYIEEHKLESLIAEEPIQSPSTTDEPAPEPECPPEPIAPATVPPKTGKRARNNQALWEPVRTIARAWWAEEGDSLHISVAIMRIKKMPHLPASAYGISAIRKHINDLAPPKARKPGRKSKKSP